MVFRKDQAHPEAVNKAKESLPSDDLIFNLADFFKTFLVIQHVLKLYVH